MSKPIEVTVVNGVLPEPPAEFQELPDGSSITWNVLCGTDVPVPRTDIDGTLTFTLEDLIAMRDNFKAGVLGIYPSVFIGHENRSSATPAMGTVLDLEVVSEKEDLSKFTLYFKTRWIKEGAEDVRSGKYKYVSVEANLMDVYGWVVKAVALTNAPAYKPMPQVAASEPIEKQTQQQKGGVMNEEITKLIDPVKYLAYLASTPEGMEALAKFYKDKADAFMPAEPTPPTSTEQTPPVPPAEPTEVEKKATEEAAKKAEEEKLSQEEQKAVAASSLSAKALNAFDAEIKTLRSAGVGIPSGYLHEVRAGVAASSYTFGVEKAAEEGVKKVLSFTTKKDIKPGAGVSASEGDQSVSKLAQQIRQFAGGK